MTPFEALGYPVDTVFEVRNPHHPLNGERFVLDQDDGTHHPYWRSTGDATIQCIYIGNMRPVSVPAEEPPVGTETFGPLTAQAFKADAGKPRWSLLMRGCSNALAGVVRVLTFAVTPPDQGGKGYVPHSWKQVPNAAERYEDALYRHLAQLRAGEEVDPESGESHWAHVATNALFLAEFATHPEVVDVPETT